MRVLFGLILLLACVFARGQFANSAWPKYQGNVGNTGLGVGFGATSTVRWRFITDDVNRSSPAIGANGTIYFACLDWNVYALDSLSGSRKWVFNAGAPIESSPAVDGEGNIYVGVDPWIGSGVDSPCAGCFVAINGATGSVAWTVGNGVGFTASPTIGENGIVYAGSQSGSIYAVRPVDGAVVWQFTAPSLSGQQPPAFRSALAIGPNGNIYASCQNGVFYALDGLTGSVLWSVNAGNALFASPVVGADGTVYISFQDNTLHAFNGTTGAPLWKFSQGNPIGGIVIGPDGTIFTGSGNSICGVNATTGDLAWSVDLGQSASVAAVASDGTLYVTTADGALSAVSGSNGSMIWSSPSNAGGIAIDADGTLYVAGFGGIMMAFQSSNPAPASVTLSPTSITGGNPVTATVTLNTAAPAGGTVVKIATHSPSATAPSSFTIAEGQIQGSFTVSTVAVLQATPIDVTVTSSGESQRARLNVQPPVLQTIGLNPATVTGDLSSVGTVSIGSPAPSNGLPISLSTGAATVSVPSTVVIPSGQTSATFPIMTSAVASQATVTVEAYSNGVKQVALLTVNPPSLQGLTFSPNSITGGLSSKGTIVLAGPAPAGGLVVQVDCSNSIVVVPAMVTVGAGQTSITFSATSLSVTRQQTVTVTVSLGTQTVTTLLTVNPTALASLSLNPATVPGGTTTLGTVNLTGPAPSSGSTVKLTSGNTNASLPSSVTVHAGQSSASFIVKTSVVKSMQATTIAASMGNIYKTALLTIQTPQILSIDLNATSFVGGSNAVGTVTSTAPALAGGLVVKLSVNSKSAMVPASVTIPAGKSSVTFTVKSTPVQNLTQVLVSGATSSATQNATLTITPPVLISISLSPSTVSGGKSSSGTVTISGASPVGGMTISLASSLSSAAVPATVTLAAGKTSATFTIKTSKVTSKSTATITATMSGASKAATLTIS